MAEKRTTPNGPDDFDIHSVGGFSGYISALDPTILVAQAIVRGSYNVYKKISGTLANRPGRKLYDATTDPTVAPIVSAFVWNTSLGATYPLRAVNAKLQFYSTISGTGAWYDLLTGLTKLRFVFDAYWDNTDKKSKLLAVNGTGGTIFNWAGGVGLFVSAINNTSITLDRDVATAGFASSGTVVINGHTYAYASISGSTLTGITGDASAEPVNSVSFSQIITSTSFTSGPASTFACDFLKIIANQLLVCSYTSQLAYLSKNTSYTDFSFSTPRLSGEGEVIILDASPTGIGQIDGSPAIFYGDSHLVKITFAQITVGTTLAEETNQAKVYLGNNCAAYAHEFIDQLNGNIVYLDQAQQLRTYGTFTNAFAAKPVLLSQAVQDELAEQSFVGGQLKVESDRRGDIVYINAPVQGVTYLYQERTTLNALGQIETERLWYSPQTWGVSRVDAIAGRAVGFSYSNPQTYYLWDTNQYHDDAPGGSLVYNSVALFAYHNIGRRQGKLSFDKVYWEGYMTPNSHVYGGIYYDYEGSNGILSPVINNQDSLLTDGNGGSAQQLFSGQIPPSLGDASLGDNPLGDGLTTAPDDQASVPKFRCITGIEPTDCFEYALMIYSDSIDSRWELLALGTNATMSFAQAVEIQKA